MTQYTPQTKGHFLAIKTTAMNAIFALYDREVEARSRGDDHRGDQLRQMRSQIERELGAIRQAEIDYLLSPDTIAKAEAKLAAVRKDMTGSLVKLKRVEVGLTQVSEFLTVMLRLVTLF